MIVTKNNIQLNVIESDNIAFWRDAFSWWESSTVDFILSHTSPNKTFIDIGAWIGPISMLACQNSKQCIAFEPDPVAYNELISNIQLNGITNIIAENKAVSVYDVIQIGNTKLGDSCTRDSCDVNPIMCECMSISDILNKYKLNESTISVIKIDKARKVLS